jgi:folate-dependent phosphoribosylglycinamide formyltransferase PurN
VRVLLLLGPSLDWYFSEALAPLFDSPEIEVVGALVQERAPGFRRRAFVRELRKGRGGYVLVMAAGNLHRASRGASQPSTSFMEARSVPAWPAESLYAAETLELMRSTRPDVIFRSGFGIIREPVLTLAPLGVLSYHHGDIRRYRGQPVAFWELYNGEREMAVTLQILDEKLDAGTIVDQRAVPIHRTDTWALLERRAYETGIPMLEAACTALARREAEPQVVPSGELGDLYTLPNLRQWLRLQGKVARRRARARRGG